MRISNDVFKRFAVASVFALQLGASSAQEGVAVPPENKPVVQIDDIALQIERSHQLKAIEGNALVIGRDLQALTVYSNEASVQIEATAEKIRATSEMQEALNKYMVTRPDYAYEPVAVDGVFGRDTASALLRVAEIENLKYLLLDVVGLQDEANEIPYRFLRTHLKKAAPDEFLATLSGIAGKNERALQASNKREFVRCVSFDERRFAEKIVDSEVEKIVLEDGYISPFIDSDCARYLTGLPKYDFKTLQIEFLMVSTIVEKQNAKPEEEWCLVEDYDFTFGKRCTTLGL